MASRFDALVVGAGIVGTACARALAAAGLSVGIVERDVVGSGATAAGMGHIVVMDDSPAQLALTRYSQKLWEALVATEPAGHEYGRCGSIWVAADAAEMEAVREKGALYAAHGIPSTVLDAPALYTLEPHLRPGLAGGLLVPEDGVVYPPCSAARLLQRAVADGAQVVRSTVARLVQDGVQLANGEVLRSQAVVIANGVHARDLLPDLPIRAKKGHLAITDRIPHVVHHQLVEMGYIGSTHVASGDSVAFNVQPRETGQVLIGSSRQFDAPAHTVDYGILSRMLRRALDYMPVLAGMPCIRVWTGERAATPDGLPLIGPHPHRPGVWLATGHEGLGITTAPATAALLVAQMLGRAGEIPVGPYQPARVLREAEYV